MKTEVSEKMLLTKIRTKKSNNTINMISRRREVSKARLKMKRKPLIAVLLGYWIIFLIRNAWF